MGLERTELALCSSRTYAKRGWLSNAVRGGSLTRRTMPLGRARDSSGFFALFRVRFFRVSIHATFAPEKRKMPTSQSEPIAPKSMLEELDMLIEKYHLLK